MREGYEVNKVTRSDAEGKAQGTVAKNFLKLDRVEKGECVMERNVSIVERLAGIVVAAALIVVGLGFMVLGVSFLPLIGIVVGVTAISLSSNFLFPRAIAEHNPTSGFMVPGECVACVL